MRIPLILKVILRKFIIRSYYDRDGYPKKCPICDSGSIDSRIKDRIEFIACEEQFYCRGCKANVAYWAYGYFVPTDDWVFTWEWYKEVKGVDA